MYDWQAHDQRQREERAARVADRLRKGLPVFTDWLQHEGPPFKGSKT